MPTGFRFAEPCWLVFVCLAVVPWFRVRQLPRLPWPGTGGELIQSRLVAFFPLALSSLAIVVLSIALARPQTNSGWAPVRASGICIVVAFDVSASMASSSGSASRLDLAREAFKYFLAGRPSDLIGLIAFARSPDTTVPPTLDHGFLEEAAQGLVAAPPEEAGTSLGNAIVWAGQEALATTARRKVVVLISDGNDEPGSAEAISATEGADLAFEQGVIVHVISVKENPESNLGVRPEAPVSDEADDLLLKIAKRGGGKVFDGQGGAGLVRAFTELDQLERSTQKEQVPIRYREWFSTILGLALGVLACERLLRWFRCRELL